MCQWLGKLDLWPVEGIKKQSFLNKLKHFKTQDLKGIIKRHIFPIEFGLRPISDVETAITLEPVEKTFKKYLF